MAIRNFSILAWKSICKLQCPHNPFCQSRFSNWIFRIIEQYPRSNTRHPNSPNLKKWKVAWKYSMLLRQVYFITLKKSPNSYANWTFHSSMAFSSKTSSSAQKLPKDTLFGILSKFLSFLFSSLHFSWNSRNLSKHSRTSIVWNEIRLMTVPKKVACVFFLHPADEFCFLVVICDPSWPHNRLRETFSAFFLDQR